MFPAPLMTSTVQNGNESEKYENSKIRPPPPFCMSVHGKTGLIYKWLSYPKDCLCMETTKFKQFILTSFRLRARKEPANQAEIHFHGLYRCHWTKKMPVELEFLQFDFFLTQPFTVWCFTLCHPVSKFLSPTWSTPFPQQRATAG